LTEYKLSGDPGVSSELKRLLANYSFEILLALLFFRGFYLGTLPHHHFIVNFLLGPEKGLFDLGDIHMGAKEN
jgi:hypothetical protein